MVRWRNWTGDQACVARRLARPRSAAEAAATVARAAADGETVRVAGAGHSFNDAVATDGVLLRLDRMDRVLAVDRAAGLARVQAGARLGAVSRVLARHGLALASLGDIDRQTLGGAVATATHGTGAGLGSLSGDVAEVELARADGTVERLAGGDRLRAARVSLGALGVVTAVVLRCVPAFRLRFAERPVPLDRALRALDEHVAAHDHFELFAYPYTGRALARFRDRTDAPAGGRSALRTFTMENVALEGLSRAGRRWPRAVPRLDRLAMRASGGRTYVASSHEAFTSRRRVHFTEMEYAVPAAAAREAVAGALRIVRQRRVPLTLPLEVRFVGGEDALLSPFAGGPRCTVSAHVYRGVPWRPAFAALEELLAGLGGRPHWGKRHSLTARELAPRYPGWERFAAVRDVLDPGRTFANAHLQRVLG